MNISFSLPRKTDVRIKGAGSHLDEFDYSQTCGKLGYNFHRDGQDLVIKSKEMDAKNRRPLRFTGPISLQDRERVVEATLSGLSEPFEGKYRERNFKSFPHFEPYGIVAELSKRQYQFLAHPKEHLAAHIKNDLLPFVEEQFQAQYLFVSSVDADYVQAAISFFKFMYLTQNIGVQEAKAHVQGSRATDDIVPMSLNYHRYVDSVLLSSPVSSVISFERPGLILYFTKTNPWVFPHIATENLFDHVTKSSEPFVQRFLDPRSFISVMIGEANWKYVRAALQIFGEFTNTLLDPRSYVDEQGVFSAESAFLVNAAFRLIFHEVSDIGTANSRYARQRLSLLALDKISNLITSMSDSNLSEAEMFGRLFSDGNERLVCAELGKIGQKMSKKHSGSFQKFGHVNFQKIRATSSNSTGRTLDEIRAFRNLNHGIFLRHGGFNKLFLTGGGSVPDEIGWFPLLYTLAIVNNPELLLKVTEH